MILTVLVASYLSIMLVPAINSTHTRLLLEVEATSSSRSLLVSTSSELVHTKLI